jgi:hypothetical protein
MSEHSIPEDRWTVICCRSNGCPSVKVEGDTVRIRDDDDLEITLSKDELQAVATYVKDME